VPPKFLAMSQFDYPIMNKSKKQIFWKLAKIKVYMSKCNVSSTLAHIYNLKWENFGQTIWGKFEDY
jgi:hypothetical protein